MKFTKMQGSGNDFAIIDDLDGKFKLSKTEIQKLADRHFGIGFDQLLCVRRPTKKSADFRYEIYNANGEKTEQCGNGARCFARFIRERGLSDKNPIVAETETGILTLLTNPDKTVRVEMGKPIFSPSKIPFIADAEKPRYAVAGFDIGALSIGNPHAIVVISKNEKMDKMTTTKIGESIQQSGRFPNSANVGLMRVENENKITLRTYERGVGETLGCGSNACAAVVFGVRSEILKSPVRVHFLGGEVRVDYEIGGNIFLSGAAEFVFEGEILKP